jgi:hypothetical protein
MPWHGRVVAAGQDGAGEPRRARGYVAVGANEAGWDLADAGENAIGPAGTRYRSPGFFFGYIETGIERLSAVVMIRVCSVTCAAGYPSPGLARSGRPM